MDVCEVCEHELEHCICWDGGYDLETDMATNEEVDTDDMEEEDDNNDGTIHLPPPPGPGSEPDPTPVHALPIAERWYDATIMYANPLDPNPQVPDEDRKMYNGVSSEANMAGPVSFYINYRGPPHMSFYLDS